MVRDTLGGDMIISPEEFMAVATLAMRHDKQDEFTEETSALHSLLNQLADDLGFASWIDAYHYIPLPDRFIVKENK